MIRAIDTNIIVRVLAEPGSAQYAVARSALLEPFTLPLSVLMETEWVLRSVYRWKRPRIADALRTLIDLPECDGDTTQTQWIIERYEAGADFADMTHLALAQGATAFVTFDADLARRAGPDTPLPVETLA